MNLSGNTSFKTTIAVALTVIGAATTVGWIAANGVRDIKSDIADLKTEVLAQKEAAWTYQDQQNWTALFARENRFTNIDVPIPVDRNRSAKKPN